jgi:hypothetical protein
VQGLLDLLDVLNVVLNLGGVWHCRAIRLIRTWVEHVDELAIGVALRALDHAVAR